MSLASPSKVNTVNDDAPTSRISDQISRIFLLIAQNHLGLDTLDVPLRNAFEAAFKAGAMLGTAMPKATESELADADLGAHHF